MERSQDNIDQLLQLLLGGLSGSLTDEEEAQLREWLDSSPQHAALYDELSEENRLEALSREQRQYNATEALQRMKYRIGRRKQSDFKKWIPYAAAAVLAFAVGVWLLDTRFDTQGPATAVNEILPGGNRAALTLADGTTIDLSSEQIGIVLGDENITYADGSSLDIISNEVESRRDISRLELTTPKGGTYQITLSDGSKVWLNANSTLKYPSRFSDDAREVILEGEAYFEIKEQRGVGAQHLRPFKVLTSRQEIEVLGTQFNISAYANEKATKTTLVEGMVRVSGTTNDVGTQSPMVNVVPNETGGTQVPIHNTQYIILSPGEQSILVSGTFTKEKVDAERYTAWKNGYFYFKHTPFEEVMQQLARWYDVEVHYKGNIPKATFSGEMDRNLTLNAVLKLLNVSAVQVQIADGGKVIVY